MPAIPLAKAGDLEPPVYGSPPVYGPYPNGGAAYECAPGPCWIVLERRIDPYGREIVQRLRVCDEGPVYPPVNESAVPPEYGYPPRYYERSKNAEPHRDFSNFSTNSSTLMGERNTIAVRGSSGLRRKSASPTSRKPAAASSARTTASAMR